MLYMGCGTRRRRLRPVPPERMLGMDVWHEGDWLRVARRGARQPPTWPRARLWRPPDATLRQTNRMACWSRSRVAILPVVLCFLLGPSRGTSAEVESDASAHLENFRSLTSELLRLRLSPEAFAKTRRHFGVVLIPGLGGSGLKQKGSVIWGKGRPHGRRLALENPLESEAEPYLLEEFNVFAGFGEDPYKTIVDILEQAVDAEGGTFDTFPYDWRVDIDVSARRLHGYLSDPARRHKTLLLVGHSLGGVVGWQWQAREYKGVDQPAVARLILVGSPLGGSCEILRLLTKGTILARGSPFWKRWFEKANFRKIRNAAFTFPSLFEILPDTPSPSYTHSYRVEHACVELVKAMSDLPSDVPNLKTIEFWETSAGRHLLNEPWSGLTLGGKPAFDQRFIKVLNVASRFKVDRDPLMRHIPVTYVFASDAPTLKRLQITVDPQRDNEVQHQKEMLELGDGRVLPVAARNEPGHCENRPEMSCAEWSAAAHEDWAGPQLVDHDDAVDVIRVTLEHGELPKSGDLVKYLKEEIRSLYGASEARANLSAILDHGLLQELLRQMKDLSGRDRPIVLNTVTDLVQEKLGDVDDFLQLEELVKAGP